MPSAAVNDAIGAIGGKCHWDPLERDGGVLAACLVPQLWRLYSTRSARDLSYLFLALYNAGLVLTFVYLYYEDATVAWICLAIETGFTCIMLAAKVYLDNWGPHSWRAAKRARPEAKLTTSPSLAREIKIDVAEFAAGAPGPSPLLQPAPSHAAQHLLLDAKLALPAGAAGTAGAHAKPQPASSDGSKVSSGSQHGDGAALVLGTVAEMLEAALVAAGLPVQRRQAGSFPSFRRRPSQLDAVEQQQGQQGDGSGAAQQLGGSGEEDEEGGAAQSDVLFFAARDGYAVVIFYPDTATLSVDLLAASEPATLRMGAAAGQLCEQLVEQWPGSRIAASTVSRLPQNGASASGAAGT